MSTGQPMYECSLCGDPVMRRGMCAGCAEERRAAHAAASRQVAQIRAVYGDGLPQHVEPVAPLPRIAVVAPPERPQEAPKPVQAAPAMAPLPPRPVAALKLATVSVGQYRERWAGWMAVQIDGERNGQKRTFSVQQSEWVTMNRAPVKIPGQQQGLFGGAG